MSVFLYIVAPSLSCHTATTDTICYAIKTKFTVVKVMHEFIPREIHQTHIGWWSVVN